VDVAVVIPTRNMASTIGAQLTALAGQTYGGRWEVLIVDNGSSDDTVAAVTRWTGRLPGLRIVTAPGSRSCGHARNVGADATVSDALAFCDADDVVGAGWLAAMVDALSDHDLVTGPLEHQRLNPPDIARLMSGVGSDAAPVAYRFLPYAMGANLGVRRSVFDALKGFGPHLRTGEDVDFSWRAQVAGTTLHFAPHAVVHRRWPASPAGLARQHARYATLAPRLYQDYARHGMPRSPPVRAFGDWIALALRSPELAFRTRRGRWCVHAGHRVGRLVGSLRWRVLYL